jgi:hypothetical protein
MDTNYNGWTNYATWRVNLEVFSGLDPYELRDNIHALSVHEVALLCMRHVQQLVFPEGRNEEDLVMIRGWAAAFLIKVNWNEIAEAVMETAGTSKPA